MWGVSYGLRYCHGRAAEWNIPLSESERDSWEMMLYCNWGRIGLCFTGVWFS